MKERHMLFFLVAYGLVGMVEVAFMEAFSFWALRSHQENGLAFIEFQIGLCLASSGAVLVLGQTVIYPWLDGKMGMRKKIVLFC
jgi:hypothetical protein